MTGKTKSPHWNFWDTLQNYNIILPSLQTNWNREKQSHKQMGNSHFSVVVLMAYCDATEYASLPDPLPILCQVTNVFVLFCWEKKKGLKFSMSALFSDPGLLSTNYILMILPSSGRGRNKMPRCPSSGSPWFSRTCNNPPLQWEPLAMGKGSLLLLVSHYTEGVIKIKQWWYHPFKESLTV